MKVEPGDQNKIWIDKTYSKGPAMGRKLGPFANLAAIKKEIVQLSQDRKLRAPSSNEIRVSITRMGIADYKRLNGQVGFRFKDYEECVNIFCTHMNIPKEMITAEDDDAEGYDYDEDSF